jgi:hypothetical protein
MAAAHAIEASNPAILAKCFSFIIGLSHSKRLSRISSFFSSLGIFGSNAFRLQRRTKNIARANKNAFIDPHVQVNQMRYKCQVIVVLYQELSKVLEV